MNRADCLDTAKKCVCTDRDRAYGKPEDNFALIAKYWSVYLGTEINAVQVERGTKNGASFNNCENFKSKSNIYIRFYV